MTRMLPREHGAYGQIAFPLVTAIGAAGVSPAALLLAAATVAGFLAHEPAAVLLGQRGTRARRQLRQSAAVWFGCCLVTGLAAGAGAFLLVPPDVRWSFAVPLAPALLLARTMLRGEEKSCLGETMAAAAFSGAAFPVALAAGAPVRAAATIAIPFALLFVAATLAVRGVVLLVRGGGDPLVAAAMRRATFALGGGAAAILGAAAAAGALAWTVLAAAAPGLATAAIIAARPPSPRHLRRIGWALVAVSAVTAAVVLRYP